MDFLCVQFDFTIYQTEKFAILDEMHKYVADTIHDVLTEREIKKIDLANLNASTIVMDTLKDAFNVCARFYGEAIK